MDLPERFKRTILSEHLFERGECIVVAVSGGPDSTALLHLLFLLSGEMEWKLVVAHANHGFRPEESEREATFVRDLAERLQLPFEIRKLDVPGYLREHGGNGQDAARDLRYRFLLETAEGWGARKIALAHHADDQAETVLMRILRGTGVSGLTGIPLRRKEKNVELIRPLLRIYKAEILSYLDDADLPFCTDSSNLKPKYVRNKIRLEALPYLKRFNPGLSRSLNRLAEIAQADDDYMEQEAVHLLRRIASFFPESVTFSRNAFDGIHVALQRRLIKLILNYLSQDAVSADYTSAELVRSALMPEAKSNAALDLPGGIRFVREYDAVTFDRGFQERRGVSYLYSVAEPDGTIDVPQAGCRLLFSSTRSAREAFRQLEADPLNTALFDLKALLFPLSVRPRRNGDRLRIQGLNGSKKVKDIFIDAKIAPGARDRIPIVADAEGFLLWIPGVRRSDQAVVTDETSEVFVIRCLPL